MCMYMYISFSSPDYSIQGYVPVDIVKPTTYDPLQDRQGQVLTAVPTLAGELGKFLRTDTWVSCGCMG